MTRLDSFIRRLEAQRACLNQAIASVRDQEGVVIELGLGNGRTFDHLRQLLPQHRIIVFDRVVNAQASCRPADADMIVGDLHATLRHARTAFEGTAILVHSDIGCGDPVIDADTATAVATFLPPLVRPGGIVVSDQRLDTPVLEVGELPPGIALDRYFVYAKAVGVADRRFEPSTSESGKG